MEELNYRVGGGGVDMNVNISEYYNVGWGCAECGEEVMYLWDESCVWFRGPVDQEYCHGERGFAFECKALK